MNNYFETIRCEDFEVFHLDYHNQRVARTIGLNINLQEYIYPATDHLLRAKVIYTQDGIENIEYFKYRPKNIKTFKIVEDNDIEYKYKYLNREALDNLSIKKGIADEIIIIKNGFITDTSIANIAILKENRWLTPKQPLLQGTTRARLLQEEKIFEADLKLEDLKLSSNIALMNAMIGFKELDEFELIF